MNRTRSIVGTTILCFSLLTQPLRADTTTSLGDRGGEGSTVFTGLAQTPEANLFTGALGTSLKIDLPPGRKNVTPTLALQYSSAGGPSPYGYGWDLPIGRIQRSTKFGTPRCSGPHTDDFILILPSGAVELVADPTGGATYRPKVEESYLEVQKNVSSNSFVAYDRSGMKYVFGDTVSARVGNDTSVFMATDANGYCRFTTAWALRHVEDSNGNSMTISYTSMSNVLYPANINYGGNAQTGLGHFYHVKFTYTLRPDAIENDLSGVAATLMLRLAQIRVASDVPAYTEFRTYTFSYDAAPNGQDGYQSVLSSVTVSGGYPTQSLVYASGFQGLGAQQPYTPPGGFTSMRVVDSSGRMTRTLMDMDGDGFADLVQAGSSTWTVYRGGGNGFSQTGTQWSLYLPADMSYIRITQPCYDRGSCANRDTFDINGDGVPDFVDARQRPWKVYLGSANSYGGVWGFGPLAAPMMNWSAPVTMIRKDKRLGDIRGEILTYQDVVDVNGDGLPDLVISGEDGLPFSGSWQVYLNTGQGFDPSPQPYFPAPVNTVQQQHFNTDSSTNSSEGGVRQQLMDFNGDGLVDLLRVPLPADARCGYVGLEGPLSTCLEVYFNTGQGFAASPTLSTIPGASGLGGLDAYIRSWDIYGQTRYDVFDVNGDGLPDYVGTGLWFGQSTNAWYVLLNRGGKLEPFNPGADNNWPGPSTRVWPGVVGYIRQTTTGPTAYTYYDVLDFNGDGMLDRVVAGAPNWTYQVNQNRPKPNLLTSTQNGLGGTTMVFYKPSTVFDNTGGNGIPDLPFVTWVVSGMRHTDGLCTPDFEQDLYLAQLGLYVPTANNCISQGNEIASSFTYKDGRFDPSTREFRGFRTVYQTNPDPSISVTTFGQADPATKGKVLQVDTYAGAMDSAHLVRSVINYWTRVFPTANRTQLWLNSSMSKGYDLNPSNPAIVRTYTYQPDAYGNVLHAYRDGFGGPSVDTYTEYAAPQAGSRVYDKPSHTYSTYTPAGGSAQRFEEKWFLYDSLPPAQVAKGNVTTVESWLDLWSGTTAATCTADSLKHCVRATMTYDSYGYGNITQVQDPLNHSTSTIYDSKFLYPYQVTNALGHTTTTVTDYRWGKPSSVTGPNAGAEVTQYDYDAGRLKCVARPGDSLTSCSVKYTYTYATPGTRALSSVAVGHKEPNQTASYPPNQEPGYLTTTAYFDALGRQRHTAGFRVVNGADQTIISSRVEYDAAGRLAKRYDPYALSPSTDAVNPGTANNGFVTYEYLLNGSTVRDPLGRVHKVTQTDGTTRITNYNGFTTTAFDEENHKSASIVDAFGRVVRKETYTGTNPYTLYAWTTSEYDGAARVTKTTQNDNANTSILISYDTLGRKTQLTDPDSGAWYYRYDAAGNLVVQQDPKATQHVQFCYDFINRVTKKLYFADDGLTATDCTNPSGVVDSVQYTYDVGTYGKPQLASVSDASGSTTFSYDARGRVASTSKTITVTVGTSTTSKTATTSFQYDASDTDRTWKATYPDGEVVTTTFDRSGQPIALASTTSYISAVQYDLFGRATTITHANGTTDTRDYYGLPGSPSFQEGHRLQRLKTQAGATAYLDLTYADYTNRALLAQLTDNRNPSGALSNTATFGYDDLGRLTAVTNSPNMAGSYGYDPLGNMTAKEGTTLIYDNVAKPHTLTKINGSPTGIGHDANGNRTGKPGQTYEYDEDDHLTAINTSAVKFLYDYNGQRVAKVVGSSLTRYYNGFLEGTDGQLTKYYFLGRLRVAAQRITSTQYALAPDAPVQVAAVGAGRPMLVLLLRRDVQIGAALSVALLGTGLLVAPWRRKRVVGVALRHGQVIGVVLAFGLGTLPWPLALRPLGPAAAQAQSVPWLVHFHVDHLGSTQVVTTSSGAVFEHIRYKAYGAVRGHWDANGVALNDCADDRYCHEFTGYDTDPVSGLAYAGARFYDPTLGMFLTHDPARQFASPYTYTNWNPINSVDPDGAFEITLGLIALAFTVGFVATFIQASVNGATPLQAFQAGLVAGAISGVTVVGLGVTGEIVGPNIAPYVYAATVAAGGYSTYEGFRSGQYALGAVGVVTTAFGVYGLYKGFSKSAQGANGGEAPAQAENGQLISDETRSDWARSELEPAQATRNGPGIGNLDQADPAFRARVEGTLQRLERQGYQPRVASGVRTLREQIALVRAGRSTTLDSAHVWGFGADIIDIRWGWNVPAGRSYWVDLSAAAQAEGLNSGATWTNFYDPAHVELPGWRNLR